MGIEWDGFEIHGTIADDIVRCGNSTCEKSEECARFMSPMHDPSRSDEFFMFIPDKDGKCNDFIRWRVNGVE